MRGLRVGRPTAVAVFGTTQATGATDEPSSRASVTVSPRRVLTDLRSTSPGRPLGHNLATERQQQYLAVEPPKQTGRGEFTISGTPVRSPSARADDVHSAGAARLTPDTRRGATSRTPASLGCSSRS
jgi:hypothetical protein